MARDPRPSLPIRRRAIRARGAVVLLAAALAGQSIAGASEAPPEVAAVPLPDQHGSPDSVAAHRESVAVVMVVTARRLRNLRAWQEALQGRFEGVDFILIADVPADPPATYEQVVGKLGRKIPEEVRVLIDVERRWATALELDTERPNILLFDRQGRLAARFRGREEPALVERVSRELAGLVGS